VKTGSIKRERDKKMILTQQPGIHQRLCRLPQLIVNLILRFACFAQCSWTSLESSSTSISVKCIKFRHERRALLCGGFRQGVESQSRHPYKRCRIRTQVLLPSLLLFFPSFAGTRFRPVFFTRTVTTYHSFDAQLWAPKLLLKLFVSPFFFHILPINISSFLGSWVAILDPRRPRNVI
jgi:hypothetical protein